MHHLYDTNEKQAGSPDNDVSTLSIAVITERERLSATTVGKLKKKQSCQMEK